jgi:hypothetical protein
MTLKRWLIRLFRFHQHRARHNFGKKTTRGLGAQPEQKDERDGLYAKLPGIVEVPRDSSLEDYASPPRDQGPLNSCVAYALIGAYELELRRTVEAEYNGSELQVYLDARQQGNFFPKDVGCYPRDALKIAKNNGIAPEKLCPYDVEKFNEQPTALAKSFERWFRIASYHRLWELQTVKQEIFLGHPVIASIPVFENFRQGQGIIPKGEGEVEGYHAVQFIGYDDERQAFRILNSWGPNWRDKGRAWLSYDYLNGLTPAQLEGVSYWSIRLT